MSFRRSLDTFGLHPQCGFGSILEFPHVQDVITGISAFFSMEDFAETAFSLRQTDIDGFYNQVNMIVFCWPYSSLYSPLLLSVNKD